MTRPEVEALFNGPGRNMREGGTSELWSWVWWWEGEGVRVHLTFYAPYEQEAEATLQKAESDYLHPGDFEFLWLEPPSFLDCVHRLLPW
jgi:hypothetical protein